MKKIIAVFALALLFVQCAEEPIPSNKTEIQLFSKKRPSYKWPIFIPKSKVSSDYELLNDNVICDSDSLYYYVDLSLESDVSVIIGWLKNNDEIIDYTASYKNIEASHKIDVTLYPQVLFLPSASFKSIALPEIRDAVKNAGGNFGNHFQYFLSFSITNSGAFVSPSPYVQNGTCYSMPLFSSIVENNHLNCNSVNFEFANTIINNQNTIIFRVKNIEGDYMYYDFSNSPPIR